MQELRLVAVSEDGTYLVLATAGRGTRFTLPVDDRLRAAVRGHFSRLGQFEIEVESPLRPKEIQARIRSGETAEEIAESAGIPVERIRWFEGPVLQEREYMAQQAQRVAVRRPGESAPGPPLGETAEERLGRGGVDLDEVEWDSWKCEDNTWRVRLSFFDNGRPHAAEWTFDPRRRHVFPLDEIAARLTAVEWDDDDALSDTVTPLVPRRPAMKVVSSDRDPAARGLPADPGQAGAPGSLRAAEPREYIAEHGRMTEPRPAAFREPGGTTPLREAARPLESQEPHEAVPTGETVPPHERSEPRPGHETARSREATHPRETAQPRETVQPRETAQAPETDEPPAAAGRETSGLGEADDVGSREQEAAEGREAGEPLSTVGERQTSQVTESPGQEATRSHEDDTEREAPRPSGTERQTPRPAGTPGQETAQSREDDTGTGHEGLSDTSHGNDTTQDQETARPHQAGESRDTASEADLELERDADHAREAAVVREEERTRDADGAGDRRERQEEASAGTDDDVETRESEAGSQRRESRSPDVEPVEEQNPSRAKKPPAQRPAQRQSPRPPAKKKPAGRPTMPAAPAASTAQDKPATGSPAAAANGEPAAAQRPARRRKAKGKRASVPSWDEIMFGARRPE